MRCRESRKWMWIASTRPRNWRSTRHWRANPLSFCPTTTAAPSPAPPRSRLLGSPWASPGSNLPHGPRNGASSPSPAARNQRPGDELLGRHSAWLEVYSIDEPSLGVKGTPAELLALGRSMKASIRRNVGVPVSVGIAPTKRGLSWPAHGPRTTRVWQVCYWGLRTRHLYPRSASRCRCPPRTRSSGPQPPTRSSPTSTKASDTRGPGS